MKLIIKTLVILILFVLFNSCSKEKESTPKPKSTSINKIMPLGASRVEGARPEYESFRYELWKELIENDWEFDFIGTQSDDASYPEVESNNFDIDHEGRGGWTSGEILNNLNDWLQETGSPDIVLLSSPGGNDGLQGLSFTKAVSNINAIIDLLQSNNPNIIILLEQMAPGKTHIMTDELTDFFNKMQAEVLTIASNKTTDSSQVIAIDMYTGFSDNLLADDVHYNEKGAEFIAEKYYSILITLMQ